MKTYRSVFVAGMLALVLAYTPTCLLAGQQIFASPDQGMEALGSAVKANDRTALGAIFSQEFLEQIPPADDELRARFLEAWDKSHQIQAVGDARALIAVGGDGWTFPAPLVKSGTGWHFDTAAGIEEIRVRRIGRNELDAMQVVLAIADAEKEYADHDLDGNGENDYAARIISTPGKKDGLYWETTGDGQESPLGPLVSEALNDKATTESGYHGYHYRILTAQGSHAPDGAYDYFVKDRMIGGFAVLAWPVEYGESGVMTFMVNHQGKVFESDLGDETPARVKEITSFDPDQGWNASDVDE